MGAGSYINGSNDETQFESNQTFVGVCICHADDRLQ
jgi:hypothetical protein